MRTSFQFRNFLIGLLALSISASWSNLRGGMAVFSADGSKIYVNDLVFDENRDHLSLIDLEAKTIERVPVPLVEGKEIVSLARSTSGELQVLTTSELIAWDAVSGAARVFCRVPAGGEFLEHAFNATTGMNAFIVQYQEAEKGNPEYTLQTMSSESEELGIAYVRRLDAMYGMFFDERGDLFFATEGDLWHGAIHPLDLPRTYLAAYRYAPLAARETDDGTPTQLGVKSVVASGKHLYVHIKRMGGTSVGNIVRIDKPTLTMSKEELPPASDEDLLGTWAMYQKALQSTEVIADNPYEAYLAVSPDGGTVYLRGLSGEHESPHRLVRNGGKPEVLELKEK